MIVDLRLIEKPWGHERILSFNATYVAKEIFVKSAHRLSEQYHKQKSETMMLVDGEGYLQMGAAIHTMLPFVPYYIPPKTIHRLSAGAFTNCLIVEVSTPELNDIVRLEDDFGRL